MKIGILCACAPEFEPYRAALGGDTAFIHGMQRTDGVLCGHEISAVFCGIGKVNAALGTMTLIRDCGADRIIMSGVAGAIRRGVHIGQCVMITDCIYHDLSPQLITDYHPSGIDPDFLCAKDVVNIGAAEGMLCGRTVTGDVFIEQDGRESIIERFDPVCCDMETAAAAHVCHAMLVSFNCVRAISDTEDEAGLGSFEKNVAFAAQKAFDGVCAVLSEM